MSNFYTVFEAGQGSLKVVDAETGVQAGWISARGKVNSPIIVNGNRASFVIVANDGTKLGCVHQLPNGQLINQYRV